MNHLSEITSRSFAAKFPGMLKPQEFTIYPVKEGDKQIQIQSDTRFGIIDLEKGIGIMSPPKIYANYFWLAINGKKRKNKRFELTAEELNGIKEKLQTTKSGVIRLT